MSGLQWIHNQPVISNLASLKRDKRLHDVTIPLWKCKKPFYFWTNSNFLNLKAQETRLGNGSYSYDCQHGPPECRGNLLEACLIKRCEFDPVCYLPIVNCIEGAAMDKIEIQFAVTTCVSHFLPGKSLRWIEDCANVRLISFLSPNHSPELGFRDPKEQD